MIGNVNVPGASAADLANKVDKVTGKGLSTNDFTNEYKSQLDNLGNNGGNIIKGSCCITTNGKSYYYNLLEIDNLNFNNKFSMSNFIKSQGNNIDRCILYGNNLILNGNYLFGGNSNATISNTSGYVELYGKIIMTDCTNMFSYLSVGVPSDLTCLDTSNVSNFDSMFSSKGSSYNAESLSRLNLTSFDTSKATNMNNMFNNRKKLTNIYLGPNWDMRNASKDNMFVGTSTNLKVYYCDTNDTYNQLIFAGLSASDLILRTDIDY